MPVDVTGYTKLTAPNPEYPGVNLLGVSLICGIAGVDASNITNGPLRFMAAPTSLNRRAMVFYRGWNRALKVVEGKM